VVDFVKQLSNIISVTEDESELRLIAFIAGLIHQSPERLAWLLYRLDIDESQLKKEIVQDPENQVIIITNKVIEKLETAALRSKSKNDWSFDLDD